MNNNDSRHDQRRTPSISCIEYSPRFLDASALLLENKKAYRPIILIIPSNLKYFMAPAAARRASSRLQPGSRRHDSMKTDDRQAQLIIHAINGRASLLKIKSHLKFNGQQYK